MNKEWDLLTTDETLRKILNSNCTVPLKGYVRADDRIIIVLDDACPAEVPTVFAGREAVHSLEPSQTGIRISPDGSAHLRLTGSDHEVNCRVRNYADPQRFARLEEVLNVPRLRESSVLLVGCGAMGSEMARQLAAAGIGSFYLADFDFLLPVNLPRHACDSRDLMRRKVDAVRDLVRWKSPGIKVETFHGDVTREGYQWLKDCACKVDLLIATTDSAAAQFVVNSVAHETSTPFLASGVWERAFGGEVFWFLPSGSSLATRFGATTCYQCVFGDERRVEDSPIKPEDAPCLVLTPGHAGAGIDLMYTTEVALGVALALLDPESTRAILLDGKPNLIYCHSGKASEWPEALPEPFSVRHVLIAPHARCPVCGAMGSECGTG